MNNKELIFSGAPRRLDVFVAGSGENYSRSFARKLIEDGLVTVNGSPRKPSHMLTPGEAVCISVPDAGEGKAGFEDLVLFEDEQIMAVSKPAGIAVHPNSANWEVNPDAALIGETTLAALIYAARPKMAECGLERLGIVHRLDRDTSGLMVIAKTTAAQEALKDGFRDRLMQKTYIGAVAGVPAKKGSIDEPIGRASGFKKIKVWEYGREALTEYETKEKGKGCALLEIHPRTGRTNQIRIHLAHIGHPILGDRLYGGPEAPRMMLHSLSLVFEHPYTGKRTKLVAPLPKDFKEAWKLMKAGK